MSLTADSGLEHTRRESVVLLVLIVAVLLSLLQL